MTEHDTPTADLAPDTTDVDLHDHETPTEEPFSVEEVLSMARRVRRTASVCLRADLQAEWDRLLDELSGMVTPAGEVITTGELAAGEESPASRALAIQERLNVIRGEMRKTMWHVTFEAMADEDWELFKKRFKPKDPKADHSEFQRRLICETAVSPTLSMDQLTALRKKLGPTAIAKFTVSAWEACTTSGLDVPKLPASLRNLVAESSAS